MKKTGIMLGFAILSIFGLKAQKHTSGMLPDGDNKWQMVWNDEFDYEDKDLDKKWDSQNARSGHILCSRWRENAVVKDGTLKLVNRKENRGGQEWTSGNIWTREKFLYGYYECRYRYAEATATNNSFWLMTQGGEPADGKKFEIDINEGHYPNEVNSNIHNWSDITINADGKKVHPSDSKSFTYGVKADINIQFEIPITTKKLRLTSNMNSNLHIREFRAYGVNKFGYPDVFSKTADIDIKDLENYVREKDVIIKSSGTYHSTQNQVSMIADTYLNSGWNSQKKGKKWLEIEFKESKTLGCIQVVNGWLDAQGVWNGMATDYKIEYYNGREWKVISTLDVTEECNFAKDYHIHGLEWTEDELIFYLDGKEIRREKNIFCKSPAPIWLSLAIIPWAGAITDAIDGTAMEVDYVRVYKRK